MSAIPGITESAPARPLFVNNLDEMVKGQGLSAKSAHLVKEVAALLGAEASVRINNTSSAARVQSAGETVGATGIPALDNPDDVKAKEADLEKLICYLQLETDKKQAELAKDRIELQKGELESRHAEQKEKLQKSLDEMDKAAKSSLLTKIFGWLMAAAAVAFAVVSCIATGGVAVGAVIGAVMAVGMAILTETGAMSKMTEALADFLEDKLGMDKMAAQIVAAVAICVAMIALALAGGSVGSAIQNAVQAGAQAGAMVAATSVQTAAQTLQKGVDIAMKGMGLAAVGASGYASYRGYESGMAQADVTEAKKFLALMRQKLEETQEELQAILDRIQDVYSNIIAILKSETDTQNEIARQIGAMA